MSVQGVCLMVMESGTAGCVSARCVPDCYGEKDSRLCQSNVSPWWLWRAGQQAAS